MARDEGDVAASGAIVPPSLRSGDDAWGLRLSTTKELALSVTKE